MKTANRYKAAAFVMLSALSAAVSADDKTNYNERVANDLAALFQSLDRNRDDVLAPEESRGDLNLGPFLTDMDINRDELVTRDELRRYLIRHYDVRSGAR